MSSLKKKIRPSVGGKKPESRLKKVVFPDPFGPMMPAASPSLIANFTLLTAMRPPKCLLSPSAARISNIPTSLLIPPPPFTKGGWGGIIPLPRTFDKVRGLPQGKSYVLTRGAGFTPNPSPSGAGTIPHPCRHRPLCQNPIYPFSP
jgi:hypothetical protein